eukprot:CAMPEP_0173420296 /NCGR_PEP_ID=MMETSP1357-20121228/1844_1 /TAXON_ID=77926 /ORGANISM="Hemiselmis rufescens, Strain PCC563" /LENGTH=501 /DNA_ID=CAMNT_0014383075 /DNA_START=30 /DNA_END=1532 /DNA_ORIENTATION=+
MAEAAALDAIYAASNHLLDAQMKLKTGEDTFAEHEEQFKVVVDKAKVGPKTKTLALQLLPKYLGHYPSQADAALDILIDLFEEGEAYRMKAIESFKHIASSATAAVISKLVGVLAQMLLSENDKEVVVVTEALCTALEQDVLATTTALLELMTTEASVRGKAVEFLAAELCPKATKLLKGNTEAQNAVATQIKKLMGTASTAEVSLFMKILFSMEVFQSGEEGANELLGIVTNTIDLTADFDASEANADRVLALLRSARLMFNHGASPIKVMSYVSKKVLPKYDDLTATQQTALLKVIAEISPHMRGGTCREFLTAVYPTMLALMPEESTEETKLNYTSIECLLYAFHQTASRVPGFLHPLCGIKINTGQPENKIDEDFTAKLADLNKRLDVTKKQSSDFVQKLKQVQQKLQQTKPTTDDEKKDLSTKQQACQTSLRTCNHVVVLSTNLKKTPPSFMADKEAQTLSWRMGGTQTGGPKAGQKRGRDGGGQQQGGRGGGGGG